MIRKAGLHFISRVFLYDSVRAPEPVEPALRVRANVFRAAAELPELGGHVLLTLANSGEIANPAFGALVERLLK
jgi:hypothetical protein